MAIQLQTGGQRETASSFFLGFFLGADAMTQEESFRFGNHRSAKKHKQNKNPQRGLGVAQLEQIRLEEQQKSFSIPHSFPAINLQPPPNSSSVAYKHSQDPVFPIPDFHPKTPSPFANPPVLPLSWSHHETFFTNMENFSLPLPALDEPNASRKQQSLVNVSPTSSSGVNLQMEPPSNQIYTNTKSTWAEEDGMVGIKRLWSLLNDSPSNSSVEKYNHLENGNPVFRNTGLNSSLHQRNWKPLPEADFRAKDNGDLGAFLMLGLTSSSSISRSTKSSLLTTECDDDHESQMRLPKMDSVLPQDNIGGSTSRDFMSNSRFGSDETWSGSAGHQQHPVQHHFYPLHYQAGAQLYSFLCPEPSRGKSELEDKRDLGQTESKACIDLDLKL